MLKSKTQLYIVERNGPDRDNILEYLTLDQLREKYPHTLKDVLDCDSFAGVGEDPVEYVVVLDHFSVGFESVDSYGRVKRQRYATPEGVIKAIQDRVGSIDLPGLVSEDGIVKCTGISARVKGSSIRYCVTTGQLKQLAGISS